MRILVITAFWPTRSNSISGVFVVEQVEAYQALGCEVVVIAPQTVRGCARSRPYLQHVNASQVYSPRHADVPQSMSTGRTAITLNVNASAAAIVRTLRREKVDPRFDGIHVQDLRYAGLAIPYWRGELAGPIALTLHGVDPTSNRLALEPWFVQMSREAWLHCECVAIVGQPLAPYAARIQVPSAKVKVIHNGASIPPIFDVDQRSQDAERVVLSVSNLVALKGLDANLAALATIAVGNPGLRWRYDVIGEGPERETLIEQARMLGIADRVNFLGRLTRPETLERMASCDVFCLPSWGEAFGIVYVEAMSRGRPVIGCRGAGAEEIVREGREGLLVEPRNVDELATALSALLKDPQRCAAMGLRGRARAEEFSWEQNTRRYLEVFSGAPRALAADCAM